MKRIWYHTSVLALFPHLVCIIFWYSTFCNKNPPTEASSSSSRRSCYVFGVEFSATNPLVDNGNDKLVNNGARREGKAAAPNTIDHASPKTVQLSEFPSKGKQEMTGLASGSNNAKATKKNAGLFPKDTKALLSTGIFDGIFVAYGGTSKEKDKRQFAMIQGNRFLCACLKCNGQEYVSARKLEHHAGYETKHPNSGIYFGNGISIFRAVEKLQKTPRNKLFEAIRSISGSLIHEENFKNWKASYLALVASDNKVQKNIHK